MAALAGMPKVVEEVVASMTVVAFTTSHYVRRRP